MAATKPTFAASTEVDVEKSRREIQKLLERHGVTGFGYAYDLNREILSFELEGRRIRFEFTPLREEDFIFDRLKRRRPEGQAKTAMEQAQRTRWRELALGIKAKLVMVAAGITTLEEEFLAQIVLQNGQTMHRWAKPYIDRTYLSGNMPPLLPGMEKEEAE